MSTSPFMDDYSSEDYSDHDDDYYIVSAPTSPQHVRGQVEIQTQSNDLQNLIMSQQVDVIESVYFDVLPELEAQIVEEEGGCMEQSIYLPTESYFDLEAQAKFGITATSVAAVFEAVTVVEELAVGSYFDLETSLPAVLDTKTLLEEGDVIEFESLETVEADTVVGTIESMIEEFMFEVEEFESDLEVEDVIEEPNSDVHHAANVGTEAITMVEKGDVIGGSIYKGVESDYDLDAIEEGYVIGEFIYRAVRLDYDLDAVEEGDVIGGSIYEALGSDNDLHAVEEGDVIGDSNVDYSAFDRTEEDLEEYCDTDPKDDSDVECLAFDRTEEDVEEYSDTDPKDDSDVDCSAFDQTEDDVEEYSDTDPKDDSDVDCSAFDQTEDDVEEYSDTDPKDDSDVDCLAFDWTEKDVEEYSDTDPKDDSDVDCLAFDRTEEDVEEYSDTDPKDDSDVDCLAFDRTEEDVEEYSDTDPKDDSDVHSLESDQIEEEEDDVVVSYFKSSTPIRNKAWKSLVPAWVKLPITDIPALEDSSLLGRGPILILQECGNVVMNVIETLLCELSRIRNDLCRVLGALFRQRETTKRA